MAKRIKKVKVYRYYFNNGFKVDEAEYKEHKKTVTYLDGAEHIDEILFVRVEDNFDFPQHLNTKYFEHLQGTSYSDKCYMYSLRNDEETLNKFKEFYKGLVKYNIGHLTALEEDAHKQLDKWRKIEIEMRHTDD